jgi:Ni,Fe-hydrogenase III large subunit
MMTLSALLGQRHQERATGEPYESGMVTTGSARLRLSVDFYLVALLFVIMHDIETLIAHFLNVSWGPVMPAGEAGVGIEAIKGNNTYYLVSDGSTMPYRVRIRTPSFPHLQTVPLISRGHMIADLLAILGSLDFVLADVDR